LVSANTHAADPDDSSSGGDDGSHQSKVSEDIRVKRRPRLAASNDDDGEFISCKRFMIVLCLSKSDPSSFKHFNRTLV